MAERARHLLGLLGVVPQVWRARLLREASDLGLEGVDVDDGTDVAEGGAQRGDLLREVKIQHGLPSLVRRGVHCGSRRQVHMDVTEWLLDSDPAIRWQVMRDLTDEPADVVAAERARVATEGWGARLLALQGEDGQWGGGTYSPKWISTTYTLLLLRLLGLDPASEEARAAVRRVRDGVRWQRRSRGPFFAGETETCINGMVVALGAYFGERSADQQRLARMAARRAARRRRMELRGARAFAGGVVQHDDPRARGPAGGRAIGGRRPGRSRQPARAARSTSSSGGCSDRCPPVR